MTDTKKMIGTGYTQAEIIAERLPSVFGQDKFIGYIPTKDEYIVASKFYGMDGVTKNAYGWSKYFMDIADLVEYLREDMGYDSLAMEAFDYMNNRQAMEEEA
jgi:hypothetical protein